MKVYELLDKIDFQSVIIFCYFDYSEFKRVIITEEQAKNKTIEHVYVEADELYIEIHNDGGV